VVKNKNWVVTASGDRPIEEIEKKLIELGLNVEQVLDEIGCIIGTASDAAAKRARAVPGVADVSPGTEPVSVGPPDASVS
jgi:hypothetical protein